MVEAINNPYVGPRPFENSDRSSFFGRDQEIRQLASLIIARRIVVLYARSGAGKTSLLKAGLVPYLEQQKKIRVLPIARVAGDIPIGLQPAKGQSLNVLNILLYMFQEGGKSSELLGMSLEKGLERCLSPVAADKRPSPRRSLLILDQLEELFTVRAERGNPQELFRQLRSALDALPRLSLVLSLREGYIARLDPYAELLPDRLRTRFRLDMLGEAAARQAMQEPARRCGIEFTDAAAEALTNDLRTILVQLPDGSVEEQSGPYVEPVQLQVVCQRLFKATASGGGSRRIEPTDVAAVGSVDSALADYYRDRVVDVAAATGTSERCIRDWIESELITEHGIRAQVLKEPECTRGLPDRALQALVDVHLVRTETRRGAIWYELTHDRLLEPVRSCNASWRQASFSLLQRRAAVWEKEGRPTSLLMQGEELKGGNRWATAHPQELMPAEQEFLSLSNHRARRRHRRWFEIAAVATIVGALSLLYIGHVIVNRRRSRSHELAATALGPMYHQRDLALLLSLEANRIGDRVGDAFDARASLFTGLQDPNLERFLHGHTDTVRTVAFSPDNHWLASGGSDQRILLWDLGQDPPRPEHLKRITATDAPVCKLIFSPDPGRKLLAAGGEVNRIWVWDLTHSSRTPSRVDLDDPGGLIFCSLAFSPEGNLLAAGSKTGAVLLLRVDTSAGKLDEWIEQDRWQSPSGRISSLLFSPDGESLAIGEGRDDTGESHAVILGLKEGGLVEAGRFAVAGGYRAGISSLAFGADGEVLATGYGHESSLWDIGTGEMLGEPLTDHRGRTVDIAFTGNAVMSVTADGFIASWAVSRQTELIHRDLHGYLAPLRSVALSNDGERMALSVGSAVVLWRVEAFGDRVGEDDIVHRGITQLLTRSSRVTGVSFTDGKLAATVDGNQLRWTLGEDGHWQPPADAAGVEPPSSSRGAAAQSRPPDPGCTIISKPNEPVVRCKGGKLWLKGLHGQSWTALTGHDHDVLTVALSRDDKTLASAGKDWTIRLWDLTADPPNSRTLTGHAGVVYSIAFWPPAEVILASAGKEGAVIIWNVATGTPIGRPLTIYRGAVRSIAFSENGEWAATGGEDGVIVWDLRYQSWREDACRIANRNLSHDEWDRFVSPWVPRRKTCPDLPWPEETVLE